VEFPASVTPPGPAPNHAEEQVRGRDRGGPTRAEPGTQQPAGGRPSRAAICRLKATVHGPNPFSRWPISGFLRKESHLRLRLPDSALLRLCPVSSGSGARVILVRANNYSPLPDGPTRPTQRHPVRGEVPAFPHPEPPLLLAFSAFHEYSGDGQPISVRKGEGRPRGRLRRRRVRRRNSESLAEMAFLHEKRRIPFRLVWYSGVLVFWAGAPKNAVLGVARCVLGTRHVPVRVFGAKRG
jgi:hypothetical protein